MSLDQYFGIVIANSHQPQTYKTTSDYLKNFTTKLYNLAPNLLQNDRYYDEHGIRYNDDAPFYELTGQKLDLFEQYYTNDDLLFSSQTQILNFMIDHYQDHSIEIDSVNTVVNNDIIEDLIDTINRVDAFSESASELLPTDDDQYPDNYFDFNNMLANRLRAMQEKRDQINEKLKASNNQAIIVYQPWWWKNVFREEI